MQNDPKEANGASPEPKRALSPWAWGWLCFLMVFLFVVGVDVIVTGKANPGLGFGRGAVTLGRVTAWWTGLSIMAGGLIFPVLLAYAYTKRHKKLSAEAGEGKRQAGSRFGAGPLHRIHVIDAVFIVVVLTTVLAWGVFGVGSILGRRWSLFCLALLASTYPPYQITRMVFEYRAGVALSDGHGPNYDRATQPVGFVWIMGMESLYLLFGAGVVAALWMAFASI